VRRITSSSLDPYLTISLAANDEEEHACMHVCMSLSAQCIFGVGLTATSERRVDLSAGGSIYILNRKFDRADVTYYVLLLVPT
jgi:hypothetical protein